MANDIHKKKTIIGRFLGLFGNEPVCNCEEEEVRAEGQELHINPPFESRDRLKRAIARLRICKEQIAKMETGDPKRRSWQMELQRRELEIERFSGEDD